MNPNFVIRFFSFLFFLSASMAAERSGPSPEFLKASSELEAKLSQVVDTTPEGATALLALVDHYTTHAQIIGLIRHAKRFVIVHADHARHKEIIFKLIEAQQLASQHSDVVATARQFLERYAKDPQGLLASRALMESLELSHQRKEAAEAGLQAWRTYGKDAHAEAVQAIRLFVHIDRKESWLAVAELGLGLVATLPNDNRAVEIGWAAFNGARRSGEAAVSEKVCQALLSRKPNFRKPDQREITKHLADTLRHQGKHGEAVPFYQQASALGGDEELVRALLSSMYESKAPITQLDPLLKDYRAKYGDSEHTWEIIDVIVASHERNGDKEKALATTAELMAQDARAARDFLRPDRLLAWAGGDTPESVAKVEKLLLAAIARNPPGVVHLQWMLAFDIYRDRQKDPAKARALLHKLLADNPPTDGGAGQVLTWLLDSATDEKEFQRELQLWFATVRSRLESKILRTHLGEWVKERIKTKETAERAKLAREADEAFRNEPLVRLWAATQKEGGPHVQAREELLKEKLTDAQRLLVLREQAETLRGLNNEQGAKKALPYFRQLAKLQPSNASVVTAWMHLASAHGATEEKVQSAETVLMLPPIPDGNVWSALLSIAVQIKNPGLGKQILAWMEAAEKKFGGNLQNATGIGQSLSDLGMKAQGVAYWTSHLTIDRNNYESFACASKVLESLPEKGDSRLDWANKLLTADSNYDGAYACWAAHQYLLRKDFKNFEATIRAAIKRREMHPLGGWNVGAYPAQDWLNRVRDDKEMNDEQRLLVQKVVRDMEVGAVSADAALQLTILKQDTKPMERIRVWQRAGAVSGDSGESWNMLRSHAQLALARGHNAGAAALLLSMLANIHQVDAGNKEQARANIRQAYSRMGVVGFDGKTGGAAAPLLGISTHLQLNDTTLALKTYLNNQALFDAHLFELPTEVVAFVAEHHLNGGTEAEQNRAEDILRKWMIKFSENKDVPDKDKARIQWLLARNYDLAGRWEAARSEYTTVVNRYPATEGSFEARLGIGETFMSQKVYDQAEEIFAQLAQSPQTKVALRAEFLRGVLASKKGEGDEARRIFRGVLDRMPDVQLADRTLFELAEVYGREQRYMEQLDLLRTVGRLGRQSQKWHVPGRAISIVVQDPDFGISRGNVRIPVVVKTEPSKDEETLWLTSGGGGRGLFMGEIPTILGAAALNDSILQVKGSDTVTVDYPASFKAQFGFQGIPHSRISIASNATLKIASGGIVEEGEGSFSDQLAKETLAAQKADERRSVKRPASEIKPGNFVYLRVKDMDRDQTDAVDTVPVRLSASSGDQIQVTLKETGGNTAIFEGIAKTGDLSAGASASDQSIGRSPLLAIDRSPDTAWVSEPDGLAPKWLAVDMKALRDVTSISISTPDLKKGAPKRFTLLGSHDGRFSYRLANFPSREPDPRPKISVEQMTERVWKSDRAGFDNWQQLVEWTARKPPVSETPVEKLAWKMQPEEGAKEKPTYVVMWAGKFLQPRDGAVRFVVSGAQTAVMVDGVLESWQSGAAKTGAGDKLGVDVFLTRGVHKIIFASLVSDIATGASVTRARENPNHAAVSLLPFSKADFDISTPEAKELEASGKTLEAAKVTERDGMWHCKMASRLLREVQVVVHEYSGDAVAIGNVVIAGEGKDPWIPTQADILALGNNDVLEIAASDTVTATYVDQLTEDGVAQNRELKQSLTATYFDGKIAAMAYDFVRAANGTVSEFQKELLRIDPGDQVHIQVTDFDLDHTGQVDSIPVFVDAGGGKPIELTATETGPTTGIFRAHINTCAKPTEGKLLVTLGQRLVLMYRDEQNNFPGHAQNREAALLVRTPTDARLRVVESRMVPAPEVKIDAKQKDKPAEKAKPQFVYLPSSDETAQGLKGVCYQAPLTVEVVDPDAAKDSKSQITVTLKITEGLPVKVVCQLSSAFSVADPALAEFGNPALWEGRFIGQVPMHLGGPTSPKMVPPTADMPGGLIGTILLDAEPESKESNEAKDLLVPVFNVSGKDTITATYVDKDRKTPPEAELADSARIVSDGILAMTDETYDLPVTTMHLGDRIFVRLDDADRDQSDARDKAIVSFHSAQGEEESVELNETLSHSGVFTGSFALKAREKPAKNNFSSAADPFIEGFFGGTLTVGYLDDRSASQKEQRVVKYDVSLAGGSDGQLAAFSKIFGDEEMASQTRFTIAESYFELFKSHLKLERKEEAKADLAAGRKILQELAEDFPGPKYAARVAYLSGQFAQEMKDWKAAITEYGIIVRDYPSHPLAADAQFKLGQCYEEEEDFDRALEAYVTLASSYPKSPLIANAMIRMGEYFYAKENFTVAAQVGEKFIERFDSHQWAAKIAFRIGQCHYKDQHYARGGKAFDTLVKKFPDDELTPQALFWAGECFRTANDIPNAFRRYNRCRWDFPESEAAKFARGRLALPEMLAQFERESIIDEEEK